MDDFDLLRDPDGEPSGSDGDPADGPRTRRPWELLVAMAVVALGSVLGLVWLITSVAGGDADRTAAAPAPAATISSEPVAETTSPLPSVSLPPTRTVTAPSPTRTLETATALATTPAPRPTPTRTPPTTSPKPPVLPPLPPTPTVKSAPVPDVVGQRLKSAMVTIEAAGFRVSVLGGGGPAPKPDKRKVAVQRPGAGTLAPIGSTVVLVLDSI